MARVQQPYKYTINRDVSWLQFNQRVLDEASTMSVPLLERVFFLSIVQSNLDEFFMIRVGSQFDIAALKPDGIDWRSGMTIVDVLKGLYKRAQRMIVEMENVYTSLVEELKDIGVVICNFDDCTTVEQKWLHDHFRKNIMPVLSPQVIDAHHPFPHIQNDRKHLGLLLKRKSRQQFGLIPVPEFLPDTVVISENPYKVISLEELIYTFSDDVFHMYEIKEKTMFHLYRNADINLFEEEVYDDSVNLKLKMKQLLKQRNLLFPVRVDISSPVSKKFIDYLSDKLGAKPHQFLKRQLPLSMDVLRHSVSKEFKRTHPEHRFISMTPAAPSFYHENVSMINHLELHDVLLHYPYQSIDPFLKLMKEAATDPTVVSIRITIYRLAKTAKLIEYLSLAAENGKDVLVVMELRARFDEQNNIDWSERLEQAGCKIIYGLDQYKVHSKICLITRQVGQELRYITQVGTGNYNETTVTQYTDLAYITSHSGIGSDAAQFFLNLSVGSESGTYDHLLVSPWQLKANLIQLIEDQAKLKNEGYIRIKVNAITDQQLIHALAKASKAGVKIELIVRSISCILPRIKGETESIQIISIVGRFLEHARVYQFGKGDSMKLYIGSADLMTRNMERRMEVAIPVYDTAAQEEILTVLDIQWKDHVKGRQINSKGKHMPFPDAATSLDSQDVLLVKYQSTLSV